jgi:hypothetical protein
MQWDKKKRNYSAGGEGDLSSSKKTSSGMRFIVNGFRGFE